MAGKNKIKMARKNCNLKDKISKLNEEFSKVLKKEVKQGYCVHCKEEFPDIEGHQTVLHDRKVMSRDEGKLYHCSICLPEAALFIDADALSNHLNDYQHKEAK